MTHKVMHEAVLMRNHYGHYIMHPSFEQKQKNKADITRRPAGGQINDIMIRWKENQYGRRNPYTSQKSSLVSQHTHTQKGLKKDFCN